MKTLPEVDTLIVGGGWVGLLLAKELASRTSRQVVVLERGPARKTSDYLDDMDELDFAIRLKMMTDVRHETITFRHSAKDRALPVRQHGSFLPGTGVGGSGEHWSGISYRYLPEAFRILSYYRERYGEKKLPPGHALRDWGIGYDELEPYYWRAEQMLGLSGKAGNLRGKKIEGGNIFEGPRSHEFPTPPMKMPYLAAMFRDATKQMGFHPYPMPAATISQTFRNPDGVLRSGCVYCGYCERFGCMIGAKAQPSNTLVPVINKKKNAQIRTGCWVRKVVIEGGKARAVVFVDEKGEEFLQPANTVVLASWSINNTRLLLLSGLNGPMVGKNLTHQVSGAAATMFFEKPLNRFIGAGSAGQSIGDYDGDTIDHTNLPFLGGALLYTVCYGFRPMANFGVVPSNVKASWGSDWKKAALHWYDRTGRLSLYGDHFAYQQNYMDLDPTYTDRYGDPLIRFTLDWTDNERQLAAYMSAKGVEIAKAMGAKEITQLPALRHYDSTRYQSTHIQGGAIMGASPDTSVVNTYQQHWTVKNLFVIGASAFPHSPSSNPTLTALALTYRTADAMVDRKV
ncbi:MAG: GMC family oxidoreductase [Bryobacteraceae bacterium]